MTTLGPNTQHDAEKEKGNEYHQRGQEALKAFRDAYLTSKIDAEKKAEFKAKNKEEFEGYKAKLEDSTREQELTEMREEYGNDVDLLSYAVKKLSMEERQYKSYPLKRERAQAPEGFEKDPKNLGEVSPALMAEFQKANMVLAAEPKKPEAPATSSWWGSKRPEDLEYDSKKAEYDQHKVKHDKRKENLKKFGSDLVPSLQKRLEKLQQEVARQAVLTEFSMEGWKDKEKGVVSQHTATPQPTHKGKEKAKGKNDAKPMLNMLEATFAEDRARAPQADAQAKLLLATKARIPVDDERVAKEMEKARARHYEKIGRDQEERREVRLKMK